MNNNHYIRLKDAIDYLIQDKASFTEDGYELDFDSLENEDLREITRLFIEYEDREYISECFFDPTEDIVNDNITIHLLTLLKDDSKDNKLAIADFILERTINTYKPRIKDLVETRSEHLTYDYMEDNGFMPVMDQQTGVYEWRKQA
jgi:hypothetical protein